MRLASCSIVTLLTLASPALADVKLCDYRPSELIGTHSGALKGAAAVGSMAGVPAVGGAGMKGFYVLSDVVGAPANDAVEPEKKRLGLKDAAGLVSSAVSAVSSAAMLSPAALAAGAVAGVGMAGMEKVCQLRDERIDDPQAVMLILYQVADNADPEYFARTTVEGDPAIRVRQDDGGHADYKMADLYIVDGEIRHRKLGRDTVVGTLGFLVTAGDPVAYDPGPQPITTTELEAAPITDIPAEAPLPESPAYAPVDTPLSAPVE